MKKWMGVVFVLFVVIGVFFVSPFLDADADTNTPEQAIEIAGANRNSTSTETQPMAEEEPTPADDLQAAVPSEQPQLEVLKNASLVSTVDEQRNGQSVRRSLYDTDFKYPQLLVEETYQQLASGEERVNHVAMVANHALVRFPAAMLPNEIEQWSADRGYSVLKKLRTANVYLIQTPESGVDALDRILADFRTSFPSSDSEPGVFAEPDYIVTTSTIPDDSSFGSLWGLHNTGQSGGTADADIDAPEAWDIGTGSHQVLVGIIDTGIDRTHPDLAPNMWSNPAEIAGNGLDDDNNGFIDDVYGWDFYANDNNPHDENGHGTHCAGTIGAVGDNGTGVVGVNWNVSMVALRFLSPGGSGSTSDAIDAVNYGKKIGVDLTSNSWGGGGNSSALENAIRNAGASNILFVAAAGNDSLNTDVSPHYPSSYSLDCIVSVASSDRNDARSYFSNYGLVAVDLAAPGSSIYSTLPGGTYGSKSGTSMATPHVAGAVALMKSHSPDAPVAEIKQLLFDYVDPLPAFSGKCVTEGRLNIHQTMENMRGPVSVVLLPEANETDGILTNAAWVVFEEAPVSNITVSLTSSDTTEILVPSNVVVMAGQTSTVFNVEVLDDALVDGSQEVEIIPYADGYTPESDTMVVHDSESATLSLTLPAYTFEGAAAFSGAVMVNPAPEADVLVLLESEHPDEVNSGSVVVPAGQTLALFELQAHDDNLIDGIQTATITARVENWVSGSATMFVYDNENASLTVSVPDSAFEGDGVLTNAGTVSVPGLVTSDVHISLTSSDTSEIAVPYSVTIPLGASSAAFDITVVDDGEADGRQNCSIVANFPGFIPGVDSMSVADNELDHFLIGEVAAQQVAGVPFSFDVTAVNMDNETIESFSETTDLRATGDAGSLAVEPDSLTFSDGQWSGVVAVNEISDNVVLFVDAGGGHVGTSTVFNVTGSQIIITPAALTNTLVVVGESVTRTMVISNAGNADLEFEIQGGGEPEKDPSLILHYTFDDDEGTTVIDQSGNGNDGSVFNEHYYTNGIRGTGLRVVGNELTYSTNGGFVMLPDMDLTATGQLTMSMWIRQEPVYDGAFLCIGEFPRDRITLGADGTDIIAVVGNRYNVLDLPHNSNPEEFMMVTLVCDAGKAILYVNGFQIGEMDADLSIEDTSLASLGRHFYDTGQSATRFSGTYDDVRIYNRALSAAEVAELAEKTGDDSLIAYYPFNGNADDESGNGHDGTVNGATLTADRFGNPDSAYDFDGSSDHINCGNIIDGYSNFTIMAWVNIDSFNDSRYMGPWGQESFAPTSTEGDYRFNTGNDLVHRSFGTSMRWVDGDILDSRVLHALPVSEWHLIAQTYDGNEVRQYDNGVLVNSVVAGAHIFGNPSDFLIGKNASYFGNVLNIYHFDGQVDDLRIYERALSQYEIVQLYGEDDYGLVAHYPFNGNANDESGNGHDGTVNGATLTADRFGNPNSAYHFDGNDYIDTSDFSVPESFSVSAWIDPDTVSIGQCVIGKHTSSGANIFLMGIWDLDSSNGGTMEYSIHVGSQWVETISATAELQHLVAVVEKISPTQSQVTLYKDGQQLFLSTIDQVISSTAGKPWTIGQDWDSAYARTDFFRGDIDDVRLYNRALSESEILALYSEGSADASNEAEPDLSIFSSAAGNLVQNGDFEAGNSGFTTGYIFAENTAAPWPESGKYGIDDFSKDWHAGFYPLYDHTSGTGLMFMANGDTVPNTLWEQTVSVEAGESYSFSAWASHVSSVIDPAELEFLVDGEAIGTLVVDQNSWLEFSGEWTTATSQSVVLSIKNISGGFYEAYALDDIDFRAGSSLVAHYPFNGNANDESGNGHDGTILNGAIFTNDISGRQCMYFDGIDDFVRVPGHSDFGVTNFTLAAWVKPLDKNNTEINYSVVSTTLPEPRTGVQMAIVDLKLQGMFRKGGAAPTHALATDEPIADTFGNWNFVTVSSWRTNGQQIVELYVDGKLVKSEPITSIAPGYDNQNLLIGMNGYSAAAGNGWNAQREFEGFMDDVRIYNRGLSAAEIEELYNEGGEASLVAHYPFNGNANDESGNGHDGTVNGATLTADRDGNTDSAYEFDGVNDYIDTDYNLLETADSMTIGMWINTADTGRSILIGNYDWGTDPSWNLEIHSSDPAGQLRFWLSGEDHRSSFVVADGSWHHVVAVRDTSKYVKMYVDGVMVYSNSSPKAIFTIPQHRTTQIGRDLRSGTHYFHGAMDDVHIFDRVLSAAEVKELYEGKKDKIAPWLSVSPTSGTVAPGSSMVIDVTFDASGLTAGDYSNALLTVTGNDALSPSNEVPASMWVLPTAPSMLPEPELTVGTTNEVAWNTIAGPVSYWVEMATATNTAPLQDSGWIDATNHLFGSLSTNTVYFYRAKASVPGSMGPLEGAWSDWVWSRQVFDLTDFDGDGIPNWWEMMYFGGNGDPLFDADGDGLNNLGEYIAGMNPTNEGSSFMVQTADSMTNGTFVISWESVTGRVYSVYWKNCMTNGYQALQTDIRYPQSSYTDNVHNAEECGFYTIDVELDASSGSGPSGPGGQPGPPPQL